MSLFSPRHHFRGPRSWAIWGSLLCACVLGVTLAICQVGWSGGSANAISPERLLSQLETTHAPVMLDVRSPEEYAIGHIPGAVNLPYRQLPDQLVALQALRAQAIVVYCETGVRARIAERTLEQAGFERIFHLEGDMQAWRAAGHPIEVLIPPADFKI